MEEFCSECEKWNKRNPEKPQRETYHEGVFCPYSCRIKKQPLDATLKKIERKINKSQWKVKSKG